MKYDIEKNFFGIFEHNVRKCLDYIHLKYEVLPQRDGSRWVMQQLSEIPPKVDWTKSNLPNVIDVISEIESNITSIRNDKKELEKYLFSLLMPFRVFCGDYRPISTIKRLQEQNDTEELRRTIERRDFLFNVLQDRNKIRIVGSVEASLFMFRNTLKEYANRLDGVLAANGIDLMNIQEMCGVWLKEIQPTGIRATEIMHHLGTWELSITYLNRLGYNVKESHPPKDSFDDIIQYPDKDAVKRGLHNLIDGRSGCRVGYAILKAFNDKLITDFPSRSQFESEFELMTNSHERPSNEQERKKAWEAIRKYFDRENMSYGIKAENYRILD